MCLSQAPGEQGFLSGPWIRREGRSSCSSQDGHVVAALAHSAPFPARWQAVYPAHLGFPRSLRIPSPPQTSCLGLFLVLETWPGGAGVERGTCTSMSTKNFYGSLGCQGCKGGCKEALGVWGHPYQEFTGRGWVCIW